MTIRALVLSLLVGIGTPVVSAHAEPAAPTGAEVYRDAQTAFAKRAYPEAVELAARAARLPGEQKTPAKFLYGDALFRMGDTARAKAIYVALWQRTTGALRASAQKRVAMANRALRLPETDGLPTP